MLLDKTLIATSGQSNFQDCINVTRNGAFVWKLKALIMLVTCISKLKLDLLTRELIKVRASVNLKFYVLLIL